MASSNSKYGLFIPKKSVLGTTLKPVSSNVFGDDSDEEGGASAVNQAVNKEAAKAKVKKQTQLEIDKALQEDPNVYEYDNIYDNIQTEKVQSSVKAGLKIDKKPKYITGLLKMAEVRKREEERRIERMVQKEREAEGEQFADKEAFVTSAYKQKMLERQEQEEKEKREAAMEELLDVTKQKDLSGFYRYLYRETTGNGPPEAQEKEETAADEKVSVKKEPDSNESSDDSNRKIQTQKDKERKLSPEKHKSSRKNEKYRNSAEKSKSSEPTRHRSRSGDRSHKHKSRKSRSRSPIHRKSNRDRHRSRSTERKHGNRSASRDRSKKNLHSEDKSRDQDNKSRREKKDRTEEPTVDGSASKRKMPARSPSSEDDLSPVMPPGKPPDEDLDRDDSLSESEEDGDDEKLSTAAPEESGEVRQAAEDSERAREEQPVKYGRKTTEDDVMDARARYLARKVSREKVKPSVEQE